jgi:hypothetical protein
MVGDMGIPAFEQFMVTIEGMMGRRLTYPAVEAVRDFYDNWHSFIGLISNRQFSVQVDPFSLAHNYPQYRRYQIWTGGALILVLIGLVLIAMWFFWQVGLPLLIGAMVMRLLSKRIMRNDAKQFAEELMKDATLKPSDGGFAKLCANYIAGIIHISTPSYTAHWPQHPSNAITGQRTFIETKGT